MPRPAARTVAAMSDTTPAPEQDDPTGGDEVTEQQLDADNDVEEDTLKALDPNDSPA